MEQHLKGSGPYYLECEKMYLFVLCVNLYLVLKFYFLATGKGLLCFVFISVNYSVIYFSIVLFYN